MGVVISSQRGDFGGCPTRDMKSQITYRHMPHSPAMDERIRAHMEKLGDLHPRITTCHVVVDEVDRNKEQGRLFEIHIDVKAPHVEIVATRQRHEDPYVALDDAFDVTLRQLQDTLERQRGDVKTHSADRGDNAKP